MTFTIRTSQKNKRGNRWAGMLFGLRFARHLAVDEITGIEKSIGMQSRQGNRTRAYYRIHVRTQDGRKITAGSGIPGASRADALIDRLRKALDLPELSAADTAGNRFENTPASQIPAAAIAGQHRLKRIRLLVNGGATVLFFAIVFWQFRDAIFGLL